MWADRDGLDSEQMWLRRWKAVLLSNGLQGSSLSTWQPVGELFCFWSVSGQGFTELHQSVVLLLCHREEFGCLILLKVFHLASCGSCSTVQPPSCVKKEFYATNNTHLSLSKLWSRAAWEHIPIVWQLIFIQFTVPPTWHLYCTQEVKDQNIKLSYSTALRKWSVQPTLASATLDLLSSLWFPLVWIIKDDPSL